MWWFLLAAGVGFLMLVVMVVGFVAWIGVSGARLRAEYRKQLAARDK